MRHENISVSVIVPVYNVAPYLLKCIESILHQSHKNIEVILVDDGSTDDSGKICDDYEEKDNRISVIHKRNAGVSVARNTGIDAAKGEWICFVDGDDYVMQDYVEYLLHLCMVHHTEVSVSTE